MDLLSLLPGNKKWVPFWSEGSYEPRVGCLWRPVSQKAQQPLGKGMVSCRQVGHHAAQTSRQ